MHRLHQQEPSPSASRRHRLVNNTQPQPQQRQRRLLKKQKHRPWRQDISQASSASPVRHKLKGHSSSGGRLWRSLLHSRQKGNSGGPYDEALLRSIQEGDEEDDPEEEEDDHVSVDLQSLGDVPFHLGSSRSLTVEDKEETTTTTKPTVEQEQDNEEKKEDGNNLQTKQPDDEDNDADPIIRSKLNRTNTNNNNNLGAYLSKNSSNLSNNNNSNNLVLLQEQLEQRLASVYQGHHVIVEAQGLGGNLTPHMQQQKLKRALEQQTRDSLRQQLTRVLQERFGGGSFRMENNMEEQEDLEEEDEDLEDEDWDDSTIASRASHFLAQPNVGTKVEALQSDQWEEFTVHTQTNHVQPPPGQQPMQQQPDDSQSQYTYETIYTRQTLAQQRQQQRMAQHALRLLGLPDPTTNKPNEDEKEVDEEQSLSSFLPKSLSQASVVSRRNEEDASWYYDEETCQDESFVPQQTLRAAPPSDTATEYEEQTYLSGDDDGGYVDYEEETYLSDDADEGEFEPDDYYWDDQTIQTVADAFVSLPRSIQLEFLLGNQATTVPVTTPHYQGSDAPEPHPEEEVAPPRPSPTTTSPTNVSKKHPKSLSMTTTSSSNVVQPQPLHISGSHSSSSATTTVSESESYELDNSHTSLGSCSSSTLEDWLPPDLVHHDPDQVSLALSEVYSQLLSSNSKKNNKNTLEEDVYQQVRMGPLSKGGDHPSSSSAASGLILAAVRAMERNVAEPRVQVQACRVLRQLCEFGYKEDICQVGGVDAVLGALSNHYAVATQDDVQNQDAAEAQVVCQCLLELVAADRQSNKTTTLESSSSHSSSSSCSSSVRMQIEVTAVHEVVSVLKRYPTHRAPLLHETCFQILEHLCLGNDDAAGNDKLVALSQCGGLVVLSQALQAHWNSHSHQNKAVRRRAIATLSKLYAKLEELSESGRL